MKRNSFTLIEILGVVAIIAILATLGFAGYSYANNKSKESATQGLITRLDAAFDAGRQKSGFMPPSKDFGFEAVIVDIANNKITVGDKNYTPGDTGQNRYKAEFYKSFVKALEMDSMKRFLNESNQVIDAWGGVIYYRYPGRFNKGGVDLISAGIDGTFGEDNAGTPATDIGKYRDNGEWMCDDIANF